MDAPPYLQRWFLWPRYTFKQISYICITLLSHQLLLFWLTSRGNLSVRCVESYYISAWVSQSVFCESDCVFQVGTCHEIIHMLWFVCFELLRLTLVSALFIANDSQSGITPVSSISFSIMMKKKNWMIHWILFGHILMFSRSKLSVISVVFVFNASPNAVIPTSPIPLSGYSWWM